MSASDQTADQKAGLREESGLLALYLRLRPELERFLRARTGNVHMAEEIVQDMWFRIESAPAGPVANGRAYLFRMAHNLALDRAREARRRQSRDQNWSDATVGRVDSGEELADPYPDAEASLLDRERISRVASAIANLPAGAGQAFRLHKIEGFSHADVALKLGISRSGVEKHIAVA